MEARDLMIRTVITVTPNMLVSEVVDLLLRYRIHGAPVVDDAGHLIGMVSFVDLATNVGERVRDIMVPDPVSASLDAPIEKIATLMLDQMVRRVVIVEGSRVVGIVSASDIIHVFVNLHERVRSLRRSATENSIKTKAVAPIRKRRRPRKDIV